MNPISLTFIIFLIGAVVIHYSLPHRFRWMFLLAVSYGFYLAWKPVYGIFLFCTTAIVYGSALAMEGRREAMRRALLIASLVTNLGILFVFKYFNFFSGNVNSLFELVGWSKALPTLDILLPVGISFYTFQALGYSIDVYRGTRPAERHLGMFALFVSFFPLILSGPIERSTTLLPQFRTEVKPDYQRMTDGMKLMAWGFFQKLVIADRLAEYVGLVYGAPQNPYFTGLPLLTATYFFVFQVYCDFAGYTDIAIGAARLMGYDVMPNFRRPYFARSIGDLWRRWHISLISWFRDYLYIPLGGNRVAPWRYYLNIVIVFTMSGLWHGSQWTYVIWGAMNGVLIGLSRLTERPRTAVRMVVHGALSRISPRFADRSIAFWQWFVTFHLFCLGAVFFRAQNISDALYILTHFPGTNFKTILLTFEWVKFSLLVLLIIVLNVVHIMQERGSSFDTLRQRPWMLRWALYIVLCVSILLLRSQGRQFIYFQY